MTNALPQNMEALFALAESAIVGLVTLETQLGIKQNTGTKLTADLAAARLANADYAAAVTARLQATDSQTLSDASGAAAVVLTRDIFKHTLGTPHSQAWYEVGYRNHSLAMPNTMAARLELLKRMSEFLGTHESMEVSALNVTKVALGIKHDTLSGTMAALKAAWSVQRSKATARTKALSALRARLRGLLAELRQVLAADDPRWVDFGFNVPADNTRPDVPQNLVVTDGMHGHLIMSWTKAPRAAKYRIRKMLIGVDDDFVVVKTTSETEVDLNTFITGQRVLLEVSASNTAGESLPCDPVEHLIP
jgi:hypothetical protein